MVVTTSTNATTDDDVIREKGEKKEVKEGEEITEEVSQQKLNINI